MLVQWIIMFVSIHGSKKLLKVYKRMRTNKREEIGVELYGVQQQLARQQMLIEKEQARESHYILTHKAIFL